MKEEPATGVSIKKGGNRDGDKRTYLTNNHVF
jgi:hypothetical protein